MEGKKVIAYVLRDAKNEPYIKMAYDFGEGLHEAFKLGNTEKETASNLFNKFVNNDEGVVKYNPQTGAVYSNSDGNITCTPSYITGSETGINNCKNTINGFSAVVTNKEVNIPFFVSDGNISIFYNEEGLENNNGLTNDNNGIINLREANKKDLLNKMLS